MINFNGNLRAENEFSLSSNNRGFKFGDALFETIKVENGRVVFLEDHYFRIMSSMRMLRMEISMKFTIEFFEKEILRTVEANELIESRVRFSVFRNDGGLYLPKDNATSYIIETDKLSITLKKDYEIDLFKDHYVYSGMMSTLKTNNKVLNVLASIYADDNGLDNCILLNENKHIVEAINSNIFLVKNHQITTPSLSEGCLKGIVRKNIISLLDKDSAYEIFEAAISPFELQKADEVFLTNSIVGIQPVKKYRKKVYEISIAADIHNKLKILAKLT
jgi:branched-chain amino acid aminotransferase